MPVAPIDYTAGLSCPLLGLFEWRAGCPVHAGLDYRSELAEVLSGFGGSNMVGSIIEEPVLFLELALRLGEADGRV